MPTCFHTLAFCTHNSSYICRDWFRWTSHLLGYRATTNKAFCSWNYYRIPWLRLRHPCQYKYRRVRQMIETRRHVRCATLWHQLFRFTWPSILFQQQQHTWYEDIFVWDKRLSSWRKYKSEIRRSLHYLIQHRIQTLGTFALLIGCFWCCCWWCRTIVCFTFWDNWALLWSPWSPVRQATRLWKEYNNTIKIEEVVVILMNEILDTWNFDGTTNQWESWVHFSCYFWIYFQL